MDGVVGQLSQSILHIDLRATILGRKGNVPV